MKDICRAPLAVCYKLRALLNVNPAVDQVRRAEVRLGRAGVWAALHKSQWLWCKNQASLTEAEAYQMRLVCKTASAESHGE